MAMTDNCSWARFSYVNVRPSLVKTLTLFASCGVWPVFQYRGMPPGPSAWLLQSLNALTEYESARTAKAVFLKRVSFAEKTAAASLDSWILDTIASARAELGTTVSRLINNLLVVRMQVSVKVALQNAQKSNFSFEVGWRLVPEQSKAHGRLVAQVAEQRTKAQAKVGHGKSCLRDF